LSLAALGKITLVLSPFESRTFVRVSLSHLTEPINPGALTNKVSHEQNHGLAEYMFLYHRARTGSTEDVVVQALSYVTDWRIRDATSNHDLS